MLCFIGFDIQTLLSEDVLFLYTPAGSLRHPAVGLARVGGHDSGGCRLVVSRRVHDTLDTEADALWEE